MSRFVFSCLFLFASLTNVKAQFKKAIVGDSIINSSQIKYYSIKANLATIDWVVLPKSAATIVFQGNDSIGLVWSKNNSGANSIAKVGAMITYPNADNTFNTALNVTITPQQQYQAKPLSTIFSQTSKDGLRIYYAITCDSIVKNRLITITDSSLSSQAANQSIITIFQNKKALVSKSTGSLSIRLTPGKYIVELKKSFGLGIKTLVDTITIFPSVIPVLKLSTQTPCSGALMTFSIVNKDISKTMQATYYFGNGEMSASNPPAAQVDYLYNAADVMMTIYMAKATLTDRHGCSFESKEVPIAVQENKFTLFNTVIKAARTELKYGGDTIHLQCSKGNQYALPNPNTPFTYHWNTGQKEEKIVVKQPGNYSVWLTDKFGCMSPKVGPYTVTKANLKLTKIEIQGSKNIKAGQYTSFTIASELQGWFQFKFVFNGQQSVTAEPSRSNTIELPDWENSREGKLQVIGYVLNNESEMLSTDTLNLDIH